MRKSRFSGNLTRIAVIATALAVVAVFSVAGTLAAFSATYTWNSDYAETDGFGYSDTSYKLDIFAKDALLAPGDSGRSVLRGPNFGTDTVVWTFAESNDDVIPLIFYVLDENGAPESGSLYSAYDYAALGAFGTETPDGRINFADVSSDASSIASYLFVGGTLCWVWPSAITDGDGVVVTGEAVDKYKSFCASLSEEESGFSSSLAGILDKYVVAYAVRAVGGNYAVELISSASGKWSVSEGLVGYDGNIIPVCERGFFTTPCLSSDLNASSSLYVFVAETYADEFASELASSGTEAVVTEGKYIVSPQGDGSYFMSRDDGAAVARKLVAVFPGTVKTAARISVTVTAVVTV